MEDERLDINEESKEELKKLTIEQFVCMMHGQECEYGICDECPVTNGGFKY